MYKPRSTIILTSLLSVWSAPLLLQSFLPQCPQFSSCRASSLYLSPLLRLSSIWGSREVRWGVFLENPAPCDLPQGWGRLSPQVGKEAAINPLKQREGISRWVQGTMGWTSAPRREVQVKPNVFWKAVTDQPKSPSLQQEMLGENLWSGLYRKVEFDRQSVSFGLKSYEALHLMGGS